METLSPKRPDPDSVLPSPSCAALSINEITRRYCRERLLVEPLQWTSRHLELLQCSFNEPSLAPSITINEPCDRRSIAFIFNNWLLPNREMRICQILTSPASPYTFRKDLGFDFGRRHVKTLKCACLFSRTESATGETSTTSLPVAVYIDRERIRSLREKALPNYMSGRYNRPAAAIYRIKLNNIVPTEPLHDPCIVALLIAVAQERRRVLQQARHKEEANTISFLTHVVCSSRDKECLHLYTAKIPLPFLDMLDYPAVPPSKQPSIAIQITTVPYKPYESFRDRIFALLHRAIHRNETERKRKIEDEGIHPPSTRHKLEELHAPDLTQRKPSN